MDFGEGTNDVTLYDACDNEMDMLGIGRILDIAPHMPHSAFDVFGVFVFETDKVALYDDCIDKMDMIGT